MLTVYLAEEGRLKPSEGGAVDAPDAAWIDLFSPTAEETEWVGQVLGMALPTREDMEEIEISSRLYLDSGAAFMTATLPSATHSDDLELAPVTFVLTRERLVTIRYHAPRPFKVVPAHANRGALSCCDGAFVLVAAAR